MKNTSPTKKAYSAKIFSLLMMSLVLTQPIVITAPAHAEKTIIKPKANEADDKTQAYEVAEEAESERAPTSEEEFSQSLASERMPGETELSIANQKLLTENARLEREVNDFETQVNVLVNERSGQLYMYGVATALGSFLLGGLLSWFIFGRRKGW